MKPYDAQLEEKNFHGAVRIEKLGLLIDQSYIAAYISIGVALLLLLILWDAQDTSRLLPWFGVVTVLGLMRLLVLRNFKKLPPTETEGYLRERLYVYSTLAYFAAWSVGGIWIMPSDSFKDQIIVLYFLIGLAGSAVAVFSANRLLTLGSVAILITPPLLWFLSRGDSQSVLMAVAAVVFLLSAIRSSRVLTDTIDQNLSLKYALVEANEEVMQQARIDELTGLFNRRAFHEYGGLQAAQAVRNGTELSLVLFDIDGFKDFNDSFGHATGDEALRHIAKLVKDSVRGSDVCGRVGGEEFALLLPGTGVEQAALVAELMRQRFVDNPFSFPDGTAAITASFGVARLEADLGDTLQLADMALYKAKENGRNRVEVSSPDCLEPA